MNDIKQASQIIKSGGLVAFPTETVYGLGADARNQSACLNIFRKKGRPSNNPLIIHVASVEEAFLLADFNDDALLLVKFWPGPLSLVLPRKESAQLAESVSAGLSTIAIRVPSDPIALQLLKASACPIAAPSANKSGRLSSTLYQHVKQNFADAIFILESNSKSNYGLESTIVDLTTSVPTILRYGFITPDVIESALGKKIAIASKLSLVKAPGMLHGHYSPLTKLRINATELHNNEVGLNFANSQLKGNGALNLSVRGDLTEAAANLFAYLHELDEFALSRDIKTIAVSSIPNKSIGLAINDRLNRAVERVRVN
jgi:L-threonylcarbamoyladenylate synthase